MRGNFKRKITVIFFIIVVCLVADQSHAVEFAGGIGEPSDPYKIATAQQLISIGDDPNLLDRHFVLLNDIDLDPNLPGNQIFYQAIIAPDKEAEKLFQGIAFTGSFDGNEYKINNLTIQNDTADYLGLLGRVGSDGGVKNLGLKNVSINGSERVGGLVGYNSGTITNCYTTGSIYGGNNSKYLGGLVGMNNGAIIDCHTSGNVYVSKESWNIGGLAGSCYYGIIKDCHTDSHVTGGGDRSYYLGGLVGYAEGGTITNCYAVGSVSGEGRISGLGGLVGCNKYGGKIDNCYATADITGGEDSRSIGGLVGTNEGATIIDCYATGSVSGGGILGGLIGSASSVNTIKNCYSTVRKYSYNGEIIDYGGLILAIDYPSDVFQCFWDIEATGASESDGGTGLTTVKMHDIQAYLDAGWDMVGERENGTADIWRIPEGGGYPELVIFSEDYQPHILTGSGTPEDPYQIATAEDLGAIRRYDSSACYKLVADVNLSGITWDTSPIPEFEGSFNGNSKRIMNLTINSNVPEDVGFFGNVGINGKIRNLGLENVSINRLYSSRNLGGLAGYSSGDIDNCYVTGRISSGDNSIRLGLLVGANGSNITNCYATGSISVGDDSGFVGGLAGGNYGNITNCYVFGSISCGNNSFVLGGLVGLTSGNIIITNCYAVTSISAGDNSDDIGGLAGDIWFDSMISSSYFLTESEGGGPDNELGLPLTDEQMKQQVSFVDWDFDDIWMICEGVDYPRLKWQNIQCDEEE